ncbi:aminotransferase class III-fold pyridoxal phosphate-dependent enzyme [Massilia eburnea]|uniref:aminotransferase class III-fold pyridoxal phosphate-dependent enzyme n=1 Tax=Massilia eburnea TaxID=1776165 RepID=UPI001479107D|nr:aminotransferase class III-fold pyridoxal phosphate-dependent enzyme [Massilia eburnea]
MDSFSIVDAQGDVLHTADGRTLIDLFTAHGTVWLGHRHPDVRDALQRQLDKVWITGGYATPMVQEMRAAMNGFLPEGYLLASLASTGMEANEQALRIARTLTARNGAVGFAGAMHGKSFFTAALGWDNGDGLAIPQVHRVPCGRGVDEAQTLAEAGVRLRRGGIAAIFVEPVHATSFGWEGGPVFYQALSALAAQHGALLVYDEVLTGFHRTGPSFCFLQHGVRPDIIVFGKACGNGFPVAGVAVRDGIAIAPRMLLGSTFSNNALAAAAVKATLSCLRALEPEARVRAIESTVQQQLLPALAEGPIVLSGKGAMWILTFPTAEQAAACARAVLGAGVCIGFHNRQLRLLPPVTIAPANLRLACQKIAECCMLVS